MQGGAGSRVFWRLGYAIHDEVLARGEWLKTTQNEHVKCHVCTGRITQIDSKWTCKMADGRSEGQWLQGRMKVTTEIKAAQRQNVQNEQTNCAKHGVSHCPAVSRSWDSGIPTQNDSKWFWVDSALLAWLKTATDEMRGLPWPDPTLPHPGGCTWAYSRSKAPFRVKSWWK